MIPKFSLMAIHKNHLMAFLSLPRSIGLTKIQLVEQLQVIIETDEVTRARLLKTFPRELAVGPTEVQNILQCSPAERRRWIEEGKLPVVGFRNLPAQGIRYPVHDRKFILGLSQGDLGHWRQEYLDQVKQHRRIAIKRASDRKRFSLRYRQVAQEYREIEQLSMAKDRNV